MKARIRENLTQITLNKKCKLKKDMKNLNGYKSEIFKFKNYYLIV